MIAPGIASYLAHMNEVEGWGVEPDLAGIFILLNDLQIDAGLQGTLFEIGVHHGRTAILLALLAGSHERCVFVDLFDDRQGENIDGSGRGNLEVFRENLRKWAPGTDPQIVIGNTMELDFSRFVSGVRFAHIDGGHYKDVVLNDLHKTEAVLGPGGIVVMDDFLHPCFLGANEACNQYLRDAQGTGLSPIATGKNKLFLARRSHADRYRSELLGRLEPRGAVLTVDFHGEKLVCLESRQRVLAWAPGS